MKLAGALRDEDFVAAQFVHLRPRRGIAILGVVLGVAAVIGAVLSVGQWQKLHPKPTETVFWMPFFWVGVILYFAGYFLWFVPFRARRLFREQRAAASELEMEISPAGIAFRSQFGFGTLPWEHILRWREGRKVFVLYISSALFHVVPKRLFASEAQAAEFRDQLVEHAGAPS